MSERLTMKGKLGYASAAVGDAACYMFINTFLLFFLTTVAGIEPAAAGTITVIGAFWNALINPIIGYISDHSATKWGRRRPFIILMSIPLAASAFLLFTAVDVLPMIKPLYYGAMTMIFWTAYTGFFVPYLALGAEYTTDYNERMELRSYASMFNMVGTLIGMMIPTILAEALQHAGLSLALSWSLTGAFVGIFSAISLLITAHAAKDRDPDCRIDGRGPLPHINLKHIFGEYLQVMKLKPIRYLLFASLFALICNTMMSSNLMYFFTYNMGMSATGISLTFLYRSVMCILMIMLVKKIAANGDKRKTLIAAFAVGTVTLVIGKMMDVNTLPELLIFVVIVSVAPNIYWQIMPALVYDVCEYDELETGKHRQGAIVSLLSLVEAFSAGLGSQLLGIILQFAGFDGEAAVQSETAMLWVENSMTLIPALFVVLSLIALKKYPITKERFAEIQAELARLKGDIK
ncbi:MAG: MFS transporter [Firmicutes bacterium]|nr:MFS transporter [Bacillota bacterium]